MSIKVCHVTSLHPAKDGRIFERECKSLAKKYEVFLVAPNTETRDEDGVHIIGVSLPPINQRRQRWMKLSSILPTLYDINADVYHFHDPELIRLGLKLKRRGKKIVFDSHEDVPNQILTKTYIPCRKLVARVYSGYEKLILKQYSALVSVTDGIVERLKKINSNTFLITNFPKLEERDNSMRPWDRVVCFAGLLTPNWMLDKIVSVLPQANATMYMAGIFSSDDYLNEMKKLPGWNNVTFLGTIPHQQVLELYGKCSIGLAIGNLENPNGGYKTGSLGCTKIPEYLSSGLPVLVSNDETWAPIINENHCGIVIDDPKDEKQIADAISYLLDHPNEAKAMGERGKNAVKNSFNWESQEKTLYSMYSMLLQ